MKVETFVCNYLNENCYVVSFDNGEGFIVDCGAIKRVERKAIEDFLEKLDVVSSFISPVSPALAIHTGPGLLGAIVQYAD